jgi:hypothetical protein
LKQKSVPRSEEVENVAPISNEESVAPEAAQDFNLELNDMKLCPKCRVFKRRRRLGFYINRPLLFAKFLIYEGKEL